MQCVIDPQLLSRLIDWHSLSLEVAVALEAAGRADLARRVEAGASDALLGLVGASSETGDLV